MFSEFRSSWVLTSGSLSRPFFFASLASIERVFRFSLTALRSSGESCPPWASAPVEHSAAMAATAIVMRFILVVLSSGMCLTRCVGANRQCMPRVRNQVTNALEYRAVAGDAGKSVEVLRHDRDGKVPPARCRAGMACVLRAVVLDPELDRGERREPLLERGGEAHCEGSMTWRARNSPCAIANATNSPMPPQTLKFTQVAVGKWNAMYQLASAI